VRLWFKTTQIPIPTLTRECEKDSRELKCLEGVMKEDEASKKGETELGMSNHVVATDKQYDFNYRR